MDWPKAPYGQELDRAADSILQRSATRNELFTRSAMRPPAHATINWASATGVVTNIKKSTLRLKRIRLD